MLSLRNNAEHARCVVSLYRSLLRNIGRLRRSEIASDKGAPPLEAPSAPYALAQEVKKYNANSSLYVKYIATELQRAVQVEFRPRRRAAGLDVNLVREKLEQGVELDAVLETVLGGAAPSAPARRGRSRRAEFPTGGPERSEQSTTLVAPTEWIDGAPVVALLQSLVDYRHQKIVEQKWRADYLQNQEAVDSKRRKELPPRIAKRVADAELQSRHRRAVPPPIRSLARGRERRKRVREERAKSELNSLYLLQRYFKSLQGLHLIPNPRLLPYTSLSPSVAGGGAEGGLVAEGGGVKCASVLSTDIESTPLVSKRALRDAYDWDYVEAIVKPGLAYDINKNHYFEHYRDIVERRGPYKVRIKVTDAGPVSMPFVELPYVKRRERKQIALAVKRATKLFRLKTIWHARENTMSQVTEPKYADGSISVRGSRGFGGGGRNTRRGGSNNTADERMFPRQHYEQLSKWEALWERSMDVERAKTGGVAASSVPPHSQYIRQWTEPLDAASAAIDSELQAYFDHYNALRRNTQSKVYMQQAAYQRKMDAHYDVASRRYAGLVDELAAMNVFKHGELVSPGTVAFSAKFEDLVAHEDARNASAKRGGIPEHERFGMKLSLGDILRKHGLRSFQWGQKFDHKLPLKSSGAPAVARESPPVPNGNSKGS